MLPQSAVRVGAVRGRYVREIFARGGIDLAQIVPELVTNADAAIAAGGRGHGRIELQYSPTLGKKRIRQLGGLFNEDPHIMVMFPNNTMPYKVAAAAWGHLIGCRKVNTGQSCSSAGCRC